MTEFDLIQIDPEVMQGQPCVKGTRLTVRRALTVLGQYRDRDELRKDYPQMTDRAIEQVLAYAAANLEDRVVPLRPAS